LGRRPGEERRFLTIGRNTAGRISQNPRIERGDGNVAEGALYVVVRPNDYFKGGWVEELEDGLCQQVTLQAEGGRFIPMYNYGLIVPLEEVRDSLIKIQRRGTDMRGLKGERQKAG